MKRPRSYGDGMDEDGGGEKGVSRDWGRRDQDGDRPSPRRRFYPKIEFGGVGRKGSSSSSCDRTPEIDREPPLRSSSSSRKRFDYEPEAFDRRKAGGDGDRYRDGGDRSVQSSSPRVSYFGDRIHRADSFSNSSRRDYPKGFRSERDKPRREESTNSPWRRSSCGKDASSDDGKSVATSAGTASGRGHRMASEDTGKTNSKSSSSGEQLKSVQGSRKPREARKEASNSSEREEGELEPDVEPPLPETLQDAGQISTSADTRKTESGSKVRRELERKSSGDVNAMDCLEEDVTQMKDDDLGAGLDSFNGTDGLPAHGNAPVGQPDGKNDEPNEKELGKGGTSQSALEMEKLVPAESEDRGSIPLEGEEEGSIEDPSSEEKQGGLSLPEEELEKTKLAESCGEEKDVPPPEETLEEAGTTEMCCEEKGVPPPEEKLEKKDKPDMCTEEKDVSPPHGKSEKKEKMRNNAEEEDAPPEKKLDEKEEAERCIDVVLESETEQKEDRWIDSEVRREEVKGVSPEVAAEAPLGLFDAISVAVEGNNSAGKTLKFMVEKSDLDKGKGLAISTSNDENYVDKDDAMEGPSSRGFDLFSPTNTSRLEKGNSGVVIGKRRESDPDLEQLDLSLGLPGASSGHSFRDPQPGPRSPRNSQGQNPRGSSPVHPPATRSLPSSLPANSDGFTASQSSFSGSQGIFHNPSCSLTQNSKENFENSVGSHPLFKPVDQLSNGGIWQGNPSNESRPKGFAVPLYQRSEANEKSARHHTSLLANGRQDIKPDDYNSCSIKKEIKRERSSGNLIRSKQQEAERIIPNGSGVIDRVLSKIVSEPAEVVGRMLQEMTEQSIAYLKESIAAMVTNQENHSHISPLLETLRKRSDLSLESLSKVNPTLLEILVSLKTGLPGFVRRGKSIPPSDLAEIFLNMRCRNMACRSLLPVDDCDCKVCSQRNGFCSACMCLVCGEFDLASNTCSWVGCDVCLHWCHTDCALRHSYIRNGRSAAEGGQGGREMQFLCVACGHPSEMFGFVKEVFKNFAKAWEPEVLAKELEYIRKIFSSSEDPRGVRLHAIADQQLIKLEKKADCGEVVHHVLAFLYETESTSGIGGGGGGGGGGSVPLTFPQQESLGRKTELPDGSVASSREALPLPAVRSPSLSERNSGGGAVRSLGNDRAGSQPSAASLGKHPAADELDGVVRFKQAEAEMYQARADDARREAEGLKRIAAAKIGKIEEEFSGRLVRLRLAEAEERRRQKLQDLQSLERAHQDFLNMKTRMEADVRELLWKMEAAQRDLGR
ncbi:unnamed protein product [Spirodela intermedia]|uniref:Uncharacterized protein n=1 Tax=Spirodela intermedia TaxID=51605 RepID=A0A7I8L2B5_SPIIN|nr:unnamed protein product [Spirodela intermedia]